MKKIYISLSLLAISSAVLSQRVVPKDDMLFARPESQKAQKGIEMPSSSDSDQNRGSVIWSENFLNGLGGNNGSTPMAWSTSGPNGNIWKKGSGAIGAGCYSGGSGTPGFATVANGYMVFHADSANCVNASTNPPTITQNAWVGSLESPVINLTGVPTVNIEFQHYFRYCCTTAARFLVSVSNNGGTTWTDYDLKGNLATNIASANPTNTSINISGTAANQANVKIKFTWTGGHSHYFWAVDDINLVPSPPDEVGFASFGSGSEELIWGDYIPYTFIPASQVQPIRFFGALTNQGSNVATNVSFTTTVSVGGTGVFTGNTAVTASMAVGDTLRDTTITSFTPPTTPLQAYTSSSTLNYANIATDANLANNTRSGIGFQTNAKDFGRDNNTFSTGFFWNNDDGLTPAQGNPYIMGLEYVTVANQNIQAVKVAIGAGSQAGGSLYPIIYEVDLTASSFQDIFSNAVYDGSQVANGYYFLQAGDIPSGATKWVTLPLQNCLTLEAGKSYVIAVGTDGGEFVRVMNGGIVPPDATAFLFDAVGDQNPGAIQWYWLPFTPAIRAVMGVCDISVAEMEEKGFDLGQNYPNPYNNDTRIDYNLDKGGSVAFQIVDVTGKVVYDRQIGAQPAGAYVLNIDGTNFSAGLYYYSLSVDGIRTTRTMSVTK